MQCKRHGFDPWVRRILWRREWLPTPVFLPGESQAQRSLAGYSPRGNKESDTTEWLTHTSLKWALSLCLSPNEYLHPQVPKERLSLRLELRFVHSSAHHTSCGSVTQSWPHGLQQARPPCTSPSPGVCLNSCPLSRWCHPTISSSVIPFSSWHQSFPASGSFLKSWLFASSGQSIGVSASAPSKEYTGLISLRIDWLSLLAVQGTLKSLLQHHSSKALILQSTFTQLASSVRGLSPFSKEFYILRKSHWLILKEFFCSWSLSSWCFTLLKESEVA